MKQEEYEKILSYARKNSLDSASLFLKENRTELLKEKRVKLKSLITSKTLAKFQCNCFLHAAYFMEYGRKPCYGDELKNQFNLFQTDKLLLNGDNLVSRYETLGYDQFRSSIKFNFNYIETILDQLALQYEYKKILFNDFFNIGFQPSVFGTQAIFLTDGKEGESSHYSIDAICNYPRKFKYVYLKLGK